ncbi:hypothetical protein DSUL_80066 [Desulfovibrionales bacterium]
MWLRKKHEAMTYKLFSTMYKTIADWIATHILHGRYINHVELLVIALEATQI